MKIDCSVLEEKSSFKILELIFFSKLDWVSSIISIAKTASKKIGTLIRSVNFVSAEIPLHIYLMFMHGILLSLLAWCL